MTTTPQSPTPAASGQVGSVGTTLSGETVSPVMAAASGVELLSIIKNGLLAAQRTIPRATGPITRRQSANTVEAREAVDHAMTAMQALAAQPAPVVGGEAEVWNVAKAIWNSQKNSVVGIRRDPEREWHKKKGSYYIDAQCAIAALSTRPAESVAQCETCNGHGMIGGPSYREPDEGGAPCPDCQAESVAQGGEVRAGLISITEHLQNCYDVASQANDAPAMHFHAEAIEASYDLADRISEVIRLLDNVTAAQDSEADYLGQAENMLRQMIEGTPTPATGSGGEAA